MSKYDASTNYYLLFRLVLIVLIFCWSYRFETHWEAPWFGRQILRMDKPAHQLFGHYMLIPDSTSTYYHGRSHLRR